MTCALQYDDKMDITDKFQQLIVSKPFPTFENFKQTLKLFTELTGSQFTIKRRMRHKTNAPMRDLHIFRYVTYACICTFSTECEVFFHIESKGKFIRVTQFYMIHNHEVIYNPAFEEDDNNYDVQCDLTDQFEEMFPDKCFDTFDEFWNQLKTFQAKTGSIYIKHNACKWPASAHDKAHLVYRVVKIECVHYGRHECKSNQPNIKMSCKIGCKSCIRVTSGTGRVVIGKFNMKHNHPVPIETAIQYPLNTLLADERKRSAEYHVQADVTTEFVETFASGRFPTYNDFLLRLEEFQQVTGFYYSKRNSDLWPPDAVQKQHLKYKFAVFDCVHYGYTHNNRRQRNTPRRAGFCFRNKFGCRSTLRISTAKGYVEILTYEMRHNHPASKASSDECPPQAWLLSGIKIAEEIPLPSKRRRSWKHHLAHNVANDRLPPLSQIPADNESVQLIRPQLDKLYELGMCTNLTQFERFSEQLFQFCSHWKEKLQPIDGDVTRIKTDNL